MKCGGTFRKEYYYFIVNLTSWLPIYSAFPCFASFIHLLLFLYSKIFSLNLVFFTRLNFLEFLFKRINPHLATRYSFLLMVILQILHILSLNLTQACFSYTVINLTNAEVNLIHDQPLKICLLSLNFMTLI